MGSETVTIDGFEFVITEGEDGSFYLDGPNDGRLYSRGGPFESERDVYREARRRVATHSSSLSERRGGRASRDPGSITD